MTMLSLLREVGRGKRGSRDLTYEEALLAAEAILGGVATPAQIGAFLVAERMKMESADELRAFIHALQRRSRLHSIGPSLDCAGPYDGRTRTFLATFPTAFVLAACGLKTTLHGSPSLPPKWGVTLHEVLDALDLHPENASERVLLAAAEQTGFLYVPTERWCKPLARLRSLRQELGLRTVFNTAEKLIRFTAAPYMAVGVFHGTVFEKITNVLIEMGVQRGIVVQGMEGSEDAAVDRKTRAYVIRDGVSELYVIDPDVLELGADAPDEENWTAARQAETALAVLRGEAALPYLNLVLLNSALRLWVSGVCGSIEEGVYLARHALDRGAAWETYLAWARAVNPVSAT
jgi:anthranilate phosphoribosyltransferase